MVADHPGFHTPRPGPLHPNGSLWLLAMSSIGSAIFGWMHQAPWLVAPPIAFIVYALLEIGRNAAWAKREMGLTGRHVADTWMSGRPFRGYGGFMFGGPAMNFVIFGVAWAASSYLSSA
jgi:hypothetical protein